VSTELRGMESATGAARRGRAVALPAARVEAPRVVTFPLCTLCGARMVRLELKHIADRWPSCPGGGTVSGVYVCPGVVPGADPATSHDWDQEALAFYPHLLNRLGSRVYGWHIQTCFWEDVREKSRVVWQCGPVGMALMAERERQARGIQSAGEVVCFRLPDLCA
jgi:hypothetical protein